MAALRIQPGSAEWPSAGGHGAEVKRKNEASVSVETVTETEPEGNAS